MRSTLRARLGDLLARPGVRELHAPHRLRRVRRRAAARRPGRLLHRPRRLERHGDQERRAAGGRVLRRPSSTRRSATKIAELHVCEERSSRAPAAGAWSEPPAAGDRRGSPSCSPARARRRSAWARPGPTTFAGGARGVRRGRRRARLPAVAAVLGRARRGAAAHRQHAAGDPHHLDGDLARARSVAASRPDVVAGHSLGEYSALVGRGRARLSPTRCALVRRRGELMQEAVPVGRRRDGGGPRRSTPTLVREVAAAATAGARGLRGRQLQRPEQTVIAGHRAAVERAMAVAQGARRQAGAAAAGVGALPLAADGAGARRAGAAARGRRFARPAVPVVCNVDARPVRAPASGARRRCVRQIDRPVRWVESVECMAASAASTQLRRGRPGQRARAAWSSASSTAPTDRPRCSEPASGCAKLLAAPDRCQGESIRCSDSTARPRWSPAPRRGSAQASRGGSPPRGARVVLAARSAREARGAGGGDRRRGRHGACAAARPRAARRDRRRASRRCPRSGRAIDILVNNAGITADDLLARMSLEQWRRVLDTNLTGAFAVTKELVRGMMRGALGADRHRLVGGRPDGQRRARPTTPRPRPA